MKYVVTVNGKEYEVDVAIPNQEVSVSSVAAPKAAPAPVAAAPVAAPAPAPVAAATTKMEAPMPGNIWKVLKSVGDVVKEGDAVIILEAMKMENEILAPCDGKIATIVAAGGTVNTGDILATIA